MLEEVGESVSLVEILTEVTQRTQRKANIQEPKHKHSLLVKSLKETIQSIQKLADELDEQNERVSAVEILIEETQRIEQLSVESVSLVDISIKVTQHRERRP